MNRALSLEDMNLFMYSECHISEERLFCLLILNY